MKLLVLFLLTLVFCLPVCAESDSGFKLLEMMHEEKEVAEVSEPESPKKEEANESVDVAKPETEKKEESTKTAEVEIPKETTTPPSKEVKEQSIKKLEAVADDILAGKSIKEITEKKIEVVVNDVQVNEVKTPEVNKVVEPTIKEPTKVTVAEPITVKLPKVAIPAPKSVKEIDEQQLKADIIAANTMSKSIVPSEVMPNEKEVEAEVKQLKKIIENDLPKATEEIKKAMEEVPASIKEAIKEIEKANKGTSTSPAEVLKNADKSAFPTLPTSLDVILTKENLNLFFNLFPAYQEKVESMVPADASFGELLQGVATQKAEIDTLFKKHGTTMENFVPIVHKVTLAFSKAKLKEQEIPETLMDDTAFTGISDEEFNLVLDNMKKLKELFSEPKI